MSAEQRGVQPGDVIDGKYRVERVLGVGGMGMVVSAIHLKLEERVAIKVVLPELASQPEVTERFLREGRAAVKIRSQHVARVLDVAASPDGTPYMVMEYLEGSDLARQVETTGPLGVVEAVGYVLEACEAIAQAHAQGIVHRDLKPANLFLTTNADGQATVKVLDFGISKMGVANAPVADGGLTKTSAMMGSPTYMAPEQMRSTRRVDARADIWGIGAVLYELVAGRPAFTGETMAELLVTIMQDAHAPLHRVRPDVPAELGAVVDRCLEKDPDKRFQSVADLATALDPFGPESARALTARIRRTLARAPQASSADISAGPSPVAAEPAAAAQTAGAWAAIVAQQKRRPITVVAAAAAALAIALVAVVSSRGGRSKTSEPMPVPIAAMASPATAPAPSASPETESAPNAAPGIAAPSAPASPASPVRTARPVGPAPARPQKTPTKPKTTVDDRHG
jgi:serine/threonine-protein kinase